MNGDVADVQADGRVGDAHLIIAWLAGGANRWNDARQQTSWIATGCSQGCKKLRKLHKSNIPNTKKPFLFLPSGKFFNKRQWGA